MSPRPLYLDPVSPRVPRIAGFSLIELMISITLGLMLLSGVALIFANSSSARNEVERTSQQIENGRYAAEVLSDDLRLAGYYGELNVGSLAAPGALPVDQCSLTATDWNAWMPLHVQGYDGGAGFDQTTCLLSNLKPDTDILLIRRVRTCLAGAADCEAAASGMPYVQVSALSCASDDADQCRFIHAVDRRSGKQLFRIQLTDRRAQLHIS